MKLVILGASGMLGSVLTKHILLNTEHEPILYSRKKLPGELSELKYQYLDINNLELDSNFDFIINCCGLIKQKSSDKFESYNVNANFPQKMAKKYKEKFIHVSTDCVFSGKKGLYVESDEKDCEDDYGMSKLSGENLECCNFRTSIIGTHSEDRSGLFEWFRSSKAAQVNGYTDHFWGGVTTLRLSSVIINKIENNQIRSGLTHVYSDRLSKFDLLTHIKEVNDLSIEIMPKEAGFLDRSLSTEIFCNKTQGSIKEQLVELKVFEETKIESKNL